MYEPKFDETDLENVSEVFKSGVLTAGPRVEEFEVRFARYIDAPYVVAVNSCSSALFLSLLYQKKYTKLKTVSIPSVTHASVANSIVNAGLKLAFRDQLHVGEAYSLLSLLGANITDSAHELHSGCFGRAGGIACYSFYPTKLLGGAEGGAIATDSKEAYTWLKRASRQGLEPGTTSWNYKVMFPGWKMDMNDVQAAILNERLWVVDTLNKWRRHFRDAYNKRLGLDNQSLHVYPILVEDQKGLIDYMASKKIECSVHFKPLHLQPAYKSNRKMPVSEWWGKHEVSLPMHENMSYDDVDRVVKEVKKYGGVISQV